MAWAGIFDLQKQIIKPVAVCGDIEDSLDIFTISTNTILKAHGPTAIAYHEKKYNICKDIQRDSNIKNWREWALERGYRSSAAFPFALGAVNSGIITFYSPEPGFFTEQIIHLLIEQSRDLSLAFVTLDHEE